jgi:hypothetical protein
MRFTRRLLLAPALVLLFVTGCTNDKPGDTSDEDTLATNPPHELRIVKGEVDASAPDAKLRIISPAPGEVLAGDSVTVKAELTGYELGLPTEGEQSRGIAYSKDGQHLHVIIDDKPYMAMYDPNGFPVGKLSEGVHTLRAFPSRSWHESIKKPGAFVAETFYVKKKSGDPVLKDSLPLLTYSRPKGDYKGTDTRRVLLDFYLANAQLGPTQYKVVASIDGKAVDTLTEWVPYYIEGLSPGAHTVKLELIGPDGKLVENGPFNSAEGKINLLPEQQAGSTPMAAPGGDSSKMGGMKDTSHMH